MTFDQENFKLKNEIELLKTKLKEKDYINQMIINNNDELLKRIADLEEILNVRNTRRAGRKSKATDENIAEIKRLYEKGYSYSQIAMILYWNTGESISKSTIAKIIKEYITV